MLNSQTNYPEVIDLTNCDREPIQIPGSIQPHGVLFVLEEPNLKILQVSENTQHFFEIDPQDLLGKSLNVLFDEENLKPLRETFLTENVQSKNPFPLVYKSPERNYFFDGIAHRSAAGLILELEPNRLLRNLSFLNFYDLIRSTVAEIQNSHNLEELCNKMVKEVGKISGFDRVMIYQFDAEENGKIIAEYKPEKLSSFLGLNYPKSDIPQQARRLYRLNLLRLIVDINYHPVKIITADHCGTQEPLDLSFSVLRSVSPLHIEYLQNMGVRASMSISLIKNQQLWGLIACHHYSPKFVSYEVRKACEFLGQVMSLELGNKEKDEDYEYRIKLKKIQSELIESMSLEGSYMEAIPNYQTNLLELVGAEGAAVCFEGNYTTLGKTPAPKYLNPLIKWVEENLQAEVFATESLVKIYPDAENFTEVASGLLASCISQAHKYYILWFRPEVIQTVNWAGNPNKPVEMTEDGNHRLSPRKSFELWQETVRFKSLPWKPCEIEAVVEVRKAIVNIVLHQVDELGKLNSILQISEAREREKAIQLEKAIKELQLAQTQLIQTEKMSSLGQLIAGIAHEINNPINFIYGNLSHIERYTQDLLNLLYLYAEHYPQSNAAIENEKEEIDLEFLISDLPKILTSMKVGVERIREIVQSLRIFSRLDEAEMKAVNIHEGLESTLLILQHRLAETSDRSEIKVVKTYGNLPKVECYAGQLNQVFMNILTNAIDALDPTFNPLSDVKSLQKLTQPTIAIHTELSDRQTAIIRISDNGIGIPESSQHNLFDPFFTTKPTGKGMGIGLAICYQIIVEKHKGQLSCVSKLGMGAEFIIEIPLHQLPEKVAHFKTAASE